MGHLNISIFSIISSLILFNIASIIIIMKRKIQLLLQSIVSIYFYSQHY